MTDPQAIAAVFESIVFMLTVNSQLQSGLLGPASGVVATGGLASVDALLQRLADLTGLVVERAGVREATSVGLAYLLAGLPTDWPAVQIDAAFRPSRGTRLQDDLRARFEHWLKQMPAQQS
jgi:sugar (pentulose or hexulose) kinase